MKERDIDSINEIVDDLSRLVNNMAFDYPQGSQIMAEALRKKHRTLQQSTIRLIAGALTKYAELEPYGTDPRNEAAKEWAVKVSEIDNYFPFI